MASPGMIDDIARVYNAVQQAIQRDMANSIAMWQRGELSDAEYDQQRSYCRDLPRREDMNE